MTRLCFVLLMIYKVENIASYCKVSFLPQSTDFFLNLSLNERFTYKYILYHISKINEFHTNDISINFAVYIGNKTK